MNMLMAIRQRRRWLIIGGILALSATIVWLFQAEMTSPIDSFASCAEAGYPITETYPEVCHAGNQSFVAATTPTPSPPLPNDALTPVEFLILVEGDSGGTYPQRNEVIESQADWERYWQAVHASQKTLPPILPVDFTKDEVVALSSGREQTTGYNLKVADIMTGSSGSIVDVSFSTPTITCKVEQAFTNRYFIVKVPKLRDPITFRTTNDLHHCQES